MFAEGSVWIGKRPCRRLDDGPMDWCRPWAVVDVPRLDRVERHPIDEGAQGYDVPEINFYCGHTEVRVVPGIAIALGCGYVGGQRCAMTLVLNTPDREPCEVVLAGILRVKGSSFKVNLHAERLYGRDLLVD